MNFRPSRLRNDAGHNISNLGKRQDIFSEISDLFQKNRCKNLIFPAFSVISGQQLIPIKIWSANAPISVFKLSARTIKEGRRSYSLDEARLNRINSLQGR